MDTLDRVRDVLQGTLGSLGGTDGLGQDLLAELWLERIARNQIDWPFKERLEPSGRIRQGIPPC